jgi:hypothetical protein
MRLHLLRVCTRPDWTSGVLIRADMAKPQFLCSTMEDGHKTVKVAGKTRIPAGTYKIKLRTEGDLTRKYQLKFPDIHKGMLWIQNVPGFEWVYLHVGNTAEDSEGCILVGNSINYETGFQGESVPAYKSLYTLVANEILTEGDAELTIEDVA